MSQHLAKYDIIEEIGRGGYAAVYRARDKVLGRVVAVKVALSTVSDPLLSERMRREARAVAALDHPAVVPLYDFGEHDGRLFLIMRYMDGGSLSSRLRDWPLPLVEATRILSIIAPALDEAHAKGIIHRDIKPANILFDRRNMPYIGDFGIAKLTSEQKSNLTSERIVVGTPLFMSPEQITGEFPVDGRSDVYALGVLLFRMLTGHLPFNAETPTQIMFKHVYEPIPDINSLNPNLPASIVAALEKSLAKRPDERYASAGGFAAALAEAAKPPPAAEPVVLPEPAPVPVVEPVLPSAEPAPVTQARERVVDRPVSTHPQSPTSIKPQPTKRRTIPMWLYAVGGALALCLIMIGAVVAFQALNGTDGSNDGTNLPPPPVVVNESTPESVDDEPTNPDDIGEEPDSLTGLIVFTCFIADIDQICTVKPDGTEYRQLTSAAGTSWYASISPDGDTILFSSRRTGSFLPYRMSADGTGAISVGDAARGGHYAPAMGVDGLTVVFALANESQDIWTLNLDSREYSQLTINSGHNADPIWSPDGTQILFSSDRSGSLKYYVMNADGTDQQLIDVDIAQLGGRVDWSPDGQHLAFFAGSTNERDIFTYSLIAGTVQQITAGGNNVAPSYSPDGQWIVFTSFRDGDGELFRMKLDGSEVTQLTFNSYTDWQPRWGPSR